MPKGRALADGPVSNVALFILGAITGFAGAWLMLRWAGAELLAALDHERSENRDLRDLLEQAGIPPIIVRRRS